MENSGFNTQAHLQLSSALKQNNLDLSTLPLNKTFLEVKLELFPQQEESLARNIYNFTKNDSNDADIAVDSDIVTYGTHQGLGIGQALVGLTTETVRFAAGLYPELQGKKIKIRIADRAKGEPSGMASTTPQRQGWTTQAVESELTGYQRGENNDFFTIIEV